MIAENIIEVAQIAQQNRAPLAWLGKKRGVVRALPSMLLICAILFVSPTADAQEVKIWEFSPYDVEIWYAFDASVTLSQAARTKFIDDLDADLYRSFRAAWRTNLTPMPTRLSGRIRQQFANLSLSDLTHNELIMVLSDKHPETKTLRTFDAAAKGLTEVYVTADSERVFVDALAATQKVPQAGDSAEPTSEDNDASQAEDDATQQIQSKLKVDASGLDSIKTKLKSGEIAGALIPRWALDVKETEIRALLTLLPWQTEMLYRQRDKLFFLLIGMDGDTFTFSARELDCPMQFIGTAFESSTMNWSHAPRLATATLIQAFAPVARVEDAEALTAVVRHRAGGLIIHDENPARIRVGDVLQPIIRRDDRNGIPTLLEPLSFTFAAVTQSDGVSMGVNVYSYSGGPGLQGRKNRRTQRVLLRVRPRYESTDLQVVVRGNSDKSQPGCFVFDRHWLTEDFELLGRTDWRGRYTIPVPETIVGVLPDAIRKERFQARMAAEKAAREKEEADKAAAEAAQAEGDETQPAPVPAPVPAAEPATPEVEAYEEIDPDNDPAVIPLNQPLLKIYVKSGDNVLASLPMVPGLQPVEVAQLPDDSLRLESEAFVRGFQGEILDLIGLRNLLAARVRLYIKDKDLEKAEESVGQLRDLKTYNEMADELSLIQNRMLEESGEAVPYSAKVKIDRMFQTTRDMLQKYLQDNLLSTAEKELEAAKQGG